MEPNFLVLLDFSIGIIIKIRLTEEEKKLSEAYDDFEGFLPVMEHKYGLILPIAHGWSVRIWMNWIIHKPQLGL